MYKLKYVLAGIGVFFFSFTFILTYNLPFFWEDILFLAGANSISYSSLLIETFTLGTHNFSHPGIPLLLILLKIISSFSSLNVLWFRVIRSICFALMMILFFGLLIVFNISQRKALGIIACVGFSYPLFLTNFFIPRPEIIGFVGKYLGLLLFFYIFFNSNNFSKKYFYFLLLLDTIIFFITLKIFSPAYFVIPTLFLFILLFNRSQLLKYLPFFIILFAVYFPLNQGIVTGDIGMYSLSAENFLYMFNPSTIFSFFSLNNLYYKTAFEVITPLGSFILFFGVVLLIVYACSQSFDKPIPLFEGSLGINPKEKAFILFMGLDLIINLLFIFATFDPATRYICFFVIPLLSLMFFLVFKIKEILSAQYKKFMFILLAFLVIIVCYNLGLSVLFRFTWGSGFIGMDKASSYFDTLSASNTFVVYYTGSAADEYAPLRVLNGTFIAKENITFIKEKYSPVLNQSLFEKYAAEGNVYVIKRITSSGKTQYPQFIFEEYPHFILIKKIQGENSFMDRLFFRIMTIGNLPYAYNQLLIYQYVS